MDPTDSKQLLLDFKNLYWTRLMTIDGFEAGLDRKIPIGPDLVEECQTVMDLPPVDPDVWAPTFDPTDFNEKNRPLYIDDYKMSEPELKYWSVRATILRKKIKK